MNAKECDRESRRDTWFENRLVSKSGCQDGGLLCMHKIENRSLWREEMSYGGGTKSVCPKDGWRVLLPVHFWYCSSKRHLDGSLSKTLWVGLFVRTSEEKMLQRFFIEAHIYSSVEELWTHDPKVVSLNPVCDRHFVSLRRLFTLLILTRCINGYQLRLGRLGSLCEGLATLPQQHHE